MEDLISAIFSNIFLLGAILYGIFSLFRFASKNQEGEGEDSFPASSAQGNGRPSSTFQEQYEQVRDEAEHVGDEETVQVEKPQKTTHDGILDHGDLVVDKKENKTKEIHPFLREKWTKKRLGDGVIMREILGPPRSKRPHHTSKRWR